MMTFMLLLLVDGVSLRIALADLPRALSPSQVLSTRVILRSVEFLRIPDARAASSIESLTLLLGHYLAVPEYVRVLAF